MFQLRKVLSLSLPILAGNRNEKLSKKQTRQAASFIFWLSITTKIPHLLNNKNKTTDGHYLVLAGLTSVSLHSSKVLGTLPWNNYSITQLEVNCNRQNTQTLLNFQTVFCAKCRSARARRVGFNSPTRGKGQQSHTKSGLPCRYLRRQFSPKGFGVLYRQIYAHAIL